MQSQDADHHLLDDLITDQLLEKLSRPTGEARGLPNAAFTSEAFLAAEYQKLFPRTWVFASPASDVPNIGDVKPVVVAGRPLFMLRDSDGEVRVFSNVCPHRGARLVVEPLSETRVLTCPYHAWSFGLDGELKGRPHFHGPGQHDHGANGVCLFGVRSDTWHDWVFVNFDGQAPDFETYMAPAFARYQAWNLHAFKRAHYARFTFDCNWKLVVENFCDNYHVFKVHPGLHEMITTDNRFGMQPDGAHMFAQVSMSGEGRGLALDPGGPLLPEVKDLPGESRSASHFCNLFPNSAMQIFPSNLQFVTFEPAGASECIMHMWFYFPGDGATANQHEAARQLVYAEWTNLNAEDEGICHRLQQGRGCDGYDGGRLAPYWDAGTIHFHRQVAEALVKTGT